MDLAAGRNVNVKVEGEELEGGRLVNQQFGREQRKRKVVGKEGEGMGHLDGGDLEEGDPGVNVEDVNVVLAGNTRALRLDNWCIFCLRKFPNCEDGEEGDSKRRKRGGDAEEVVEEADFSHCLAEDILCAFNWTWWALGKCGGNKSFWKTMEDCSREVCSNVVFRNLPKMCRDCGETVQNVNKLMSHMWTEVKELRSSIRDSLSNDLQADLFSEGENDGKAGETLGFFEEFWSTLGVQCPVETKTEEPLIPDPTESVEDVCFDPLALSPFSMPGEDHASDPEFIPEGITRKLSGTTGINSVPSVAEETQSEVPEIPPKENTSPSNNAIIPPELPVVVLLDSSSDNEEEQRAVVPKAKPKQQKPKKPRAKQKSKLSIKFALDPEQPADGPLKIIIPSGCTPSIREEGGGTSYAMYWSQEKKRDHFICLLDRCGRLFWNGRTMQLHQHEVHYPLSEKSHINPEEVIFVAGDIMEKEKIKSKSKATEIEKPEIIIPRQTKVPVPPDAVISCNNEGKPCFANFIDTGTQIEYLVCLLDNCNLQFSGQFKKHRLQAHQEIVHNPAHPKHKTFFTCELCGQTTTKNSLKSHMKHQHSAAVAATLDSSTSTSTENKTSGYTCSHCGKVLSTQDGLQGHQYRQHGVRIPSSHCDFCRKKVHSRLRMQHLKTHLPEEYLANCPNPNCNFICAFSKSLINHFEAQTTRDCVKHAGGIQSFRKRLKTCILCNHVSRNGLQSHLDAHHETTEKNYFCPVANCTVGYTAKQSLENHLFHHRTLLPDDKHQICSQCSVRKRIKVELMAEHLNEEHSAQEIIKCAQCPYQFISREELANHMYVHRRDSLFCDICGESETKFSRHAQLLEHYFMEHGIGKKIECERVGCEKFFWKQSSLASHIQLEHSNVDFPTVATKFSCDQCDKAFKHRETLKSHKIREHGAEPYVCSLCPETFTCKQLKINHVNEVHRGLVKQQVFPCQEPNCGKDFRTRFQLKHHRAVVHLGTGRNHVCDLCGKAFTIRNYLHIHRETVHFGIRKWICDTCGEAFTNSNVLKKHKLIHTGERPFACDICDQRFRHKEVLATHLKGHQEKGAAFRPNGPMKNIRKRVQMKRRNP